MKRATLLFALLTACSANSCSVIPVGFFGGGAVTPLLNFDFSSSSLPTGVIATRTSGKNVYPQTGTNTVQLVTTADVPENRGTPTGWGHWTWRAWTAEIAAPTDFVTSWAISTGNGIRTAAGTTGPDGSTNGTYVYDVSPDEASKATYAGGTSTTNKVIQAVVWEKGTGVTAPTASGGGVPVPDDLLTGTIPAIEQGWAFTANASRNVTALAFYKVSGDALTSHTIHLWAASGSTLLATATTSGETSSGWQVQILGSPVALTNGSLYRISQQFGTNDKYAFEHSLPSYPFSQNGLTVTGVAYNLTPGSYPSSDSSGADFIAMDVLFEDASTPLTAPRSPGEIIPLSTGSAYAALSEAVSWTRVSSSYAVTGTATGGFVLFPAGASGAASPTFVNGAVGGYQLWGAQLAENVYQGDPPALATNGTSADLTLSVTSSTYLNQIPDGSGKLHVIADFAVDGTDTSWPSTDPSVALFDLDTPTGHYTVFAGNQSVISATVRGVTSGTSGLQANIGGLLPDSITRVELYYDPAGPTATLQALVNGLLNLANGSATSGTGLGGSVSSPTALFIGSKTDSTLISMRRTTKFARADYVGRSDPHSCEFIMLGDSLTADYAPHNNVGKYIYTLSEAQTRSGIGNFAFPGETIANQKARWDASAEKGQSYVAAALLDPGTNDVALNHSETTISTDYQNLVNDIAASNPSAEIYISPIMPAGDWSGPQLAVWQAVNADILGTGAHPITGATVVMDSLVRFNSGTDTLAARCDSGDHRHETDGCAIEWGAIKRATLQARSKLSGGSAPTCASFSPTHAAVGGTVTITGTAFTPITRASFNSTKVATLTPVSDTSFTTVVPTGATTGTLAVGSPLGSANCPGTFTIP